MQSSFKSKSSVEGKIMDWSLCRQKGCAEGTTALFKGLICLVSAP